MSAEELATLRDSVLRGSGAAQTAESGVATASTLARALKYPVLASTNAGMDRMAQEAFGFFLMYCGSSEEKVADKWKALILSWVTLLMPNVAKSIIGSGANRFSPIIISENTVAELVVMYKSAKVSAETEDAEMKKMGHDQAIKAMPKMDLLPAGKTLDATRVSDMVSEIGQYGYFSLVLFLAGKTPTAANRAAFSEKRPNALERKYFQGISLPSYTGSMKISHVGQDYIHSGFTVMTSVRRHIFSVLADVLEGEVDTGIEALAVTVRMMLFAGMGHVAIIDEFLTGNEVAFSCPMLMPAIRAYHISLKEVAATKKNARPFFKLMKGDTTRAFNRRDLEPLIVVAVKTKATTSPTLQQYGLPENAEILYAKYQEWLQHMLAEG